MPKITKPTQIRTQALHPLSVTEPPKIVGTSDSRAGALNGSASPVICISITSSKSAYPITQTLHTIEVSGKD
jgi:hypothetical protein